MTVIVPLLTSDANAAVSYELTTTNSNGTCEAIGGSWVSSSSSCFVDSSRLNAGDSLTVDSGVGLIVDSGVTLSLDENTIVNHGNITNSGEIIMGCLGSTCSGVVNITNYGTFSNQGTILNVNGVIDNYGIINNNGLIYNSYDFEFVTDTINNYNSGVINNWGTITNDGTDGNFGIINNSGTINNNSGGTIGNSAAITNDNTITNNSGATITNDKTITNTSGATINNNGTISNNSGGTINNYGTISNNSGGTLNNNSTISNNSGATLNKNGTISNNSGGTISNNSGATLNNNGTLSNNSGGIIANNSGGTLNNNGAITDYCGSTFTNHGTMTGNKVIPACSAGTLSLFPKSGLDGITSYATGKNFIPKHAFTITFDATTVATGTTNSAGAFYNMPFTVPPSASLGPHTVSATDGTNKANATFTVKLSTLSVYPKSGAAGTVSNATGHAFIPSHGITITFDGATVATTTANKEGAFYNIPFTVPATATVGPHTVSATDGTNTASATFTVK